ncbi:MAG: heme-binding domain-containing protein [Bacteroidetes bacterium]|nr:heme-binding domain-containing protein [Bacteroidota bacterium]
MIKKILIGLLAILVIIQFIRPTKNNSNDTTYDVTTRYEVPEEVASILKVACNDCHSNNTVYPWYSNLQPVGWILNNHVVDGKRHLNFSEFTKLRVAIQNHKFEEVVETVEEKEMPLESYTSFGLHPEANLSDDQRQVLIKWAQTQMDTLKAHYPADSLVLRRR